MRGRNVPTRAGCSSLGKVCNLVAPIRFLEMRIRVVHSPGEYLGPKKFSEQNGCLCLSYIYSHPDASVTFLTILDQIFYPTPLQLSFTLTPHLLTTNLFCTSLQAIYSRCISLLSSPFFLSLPVFPPPFPTPSGQSPLMPPFMPTAPISREWPFTTVTQTVVLLMHLTSN